MPNNYVNRDTWGAEISNGHPQTKLDKLIAEHERIVAALKLAREVLTGHAVASSNGRAATTINHAIAIDTSRRRATKYPGTWTKRKQKNREATAALLATLDPTEPRPVSGRRTGVLVQHGLIRRKGKGLYVRTAKEFTV